LRLPFCETVCCNMPGVNMVKVLRSRYNPRKDRASIQHLGSRGLNTPRLLGRRLNTLPKEGLKKSLKKDMVPEQGHAKIEPGLKPDEQSSVLRWGNFSRQKHYGRLGCLSAAVLASPSAIACALFLL